MNGDAEEASDIVSQSQAKSVNDYELDNDKISADSI